MPSHHGIHDYLEESDPLPPGVGPLPDLADQRILPGRLREVGYRTGLCGKWHCGPGAHKHPGFDDWFTSVKGTRAKFDTQEFNDNGARVSWLGHQAPRIAERAVEFLRETPADQPFFLVVGFTNTHSPHTGEAPRLLDLYQGDRLGLLPDEPFPPCHGFPRKHPEETEPRRRRELADYLAAVSAIDEQVGRVLDELHSLGRLDTTLVLYTSDHGHMNGHHGLHGKGNATIPQNFLEESIRIPAILRWPGHVAAGTTIDSTCSSLDLYASLLASAGLTDERTPGKNLLAALQGQAPWPCAEVFCEYGNARMIRSGSHKYIKRGPGPNGTFPDELYDLAADPRETLNIIRENPVEALNLRSRMETFFAANSDPGQDGFDVTRFWKHNPLSPWDDELVERPEHQY